MCIIYNCVLFIINNKYVNLHGITAEKTRGFMVLDGYRDNQKVKQIMDHQLKKIKTNN